MNDILKDIIEKNPKLKKMIKRSAELNPDQDGHAFSKEFREKMEKSKYAKMDIRDCFADIEFMDFMMDAQGISQENKNKAWKAAGREDMIKASAESE